MVQHQIELFLLKLNQVKTKLFLFTTFLAPILFALLSILPSWLATLDPERTSRIGLVHNLEDEELINRFKIETNKQFRTKDDYPQFVFEKFKYDTYLKIMKNH